MKKLRYKYYNEKITTQGDCNVPSHGQEESKLSSTINATSGGHTLRSDKIIKRPFNKNNVATVKNQ